MPRLPLRVFHFSHWADEVEDAAVFLQRLPEMDIRPRVANPADPELCRMARLDCDWHGENTRAFAHLTHPELTFLPARVTGPGGLLALARPTPAAEERWLIFEGHTPQKLAGIWPRLLPLLKHAGIKLLWYAFDEASRTTQAFLEFAPFLDVLIHDEFPLGERGRSLLSGACLTVHRSWVANLVPFAATFNPLPEERLLFLGSRLGLTEHRLRQIEYLQNTFKDRFVAIHDHSVAVSDRLGLNRFKVGFCPEGRKFATPAMALTHTDRPFWSGCLGMVPVSEDSASGGRLEDLAREGHLLRYARGDLSGLRARCEEALAIPLEQRRRCYEYFNRCETVGTVVAEALQGAGARRG